eukprot:CAMPEP_0198205916 /NCGR_PEP_ID=MMETSP1445-20131203/9451_1 /TAXON_ID=36898 /ORGANISM="Pyramimonas sp., Strain CCMP2087" /LENGTH=569 /DNA_ID=CAMNT_0043878403 /DNA_START=119 /DNA_END=1825 /DNA_ORIENTATION=+
MAPRNKSRPSTASVRPALREQLKLQRQNPSCDYVLIGSGNMDGGVQLVEPMGRMLFAHAQEKARAGETAGVRVMYDFLIEKCRDQLSACGVDEEGLCAQLEREYGVPRTEFLNAVSTPNPSAKETEQIATALSDVNLKEDLMAQFRELVVNGGDKVNEIFELFEVFIVTLKSTERAAAVEAQRLMCLLIGQVSFKGGVSVKSVNSNLRRLEGRDDSATQFVKAFLNEAANGADKLTMEAYKQASAAGSCFAPFHLGGKHLHLGNGREALKCYTLAAERGNPLAMHKVGYFMEVPQAAKLARKPDLKAAREWYKRAVDCKYGLSCQNLGVLDEEAGAKESALSWFQKGMELGDGLCKVSVARELGIGQTEMQSDETFEQRCTLFAEGAAAGDANGIFLLGLIHHMPGTHHDPLLAAELYKMAAQNYDHEQAMKFLPRAQAECGPCHTCANPPPKSRQFKTCPHCKLVAFCSSECASEHACTPGKIPILEAARVRNMEQLMLRLEQGLRHVLEGYGSSQDGASSAVPATDTSAAATRAAEDQSLEEPSGDQYFEELVDDDLLVSLLDRYPV